MFLRRSSYCHETLNVAEGRFAHEFEERFLAALGMTDCRTGTSEPGIRELGGLSRPLKN